MGVMSNPGRRVAAATNAAAWRCPSLAGGTIAVSDQYETNLLSKWKDAFRFAVGLALGVAVATAVVAVSGSVYVLAWKGLRHLFELASSNMHGG
jgi:hypothetical protein